MLLVNIRTKFIACYRLKWVTLASICSMLLLPMAVASGLMSKVPSDTDAANFTLMSAHGQDISLTDYRGKFVLINFWATWCPPCVKEMPALNSLNDKLKGQGLRVVAVHAGPALATVKKFLKENPVNFDVVIDKNMSLSSWQVSGLPTTFLVNPDGKLIYKATGERDWDSEEMVAFIKAVMKEYERLAVVGNDLVNS